MKTKFFVALVAFAFILNTVGTTFAQTVKKLAPANALVTLLPASDGILTFDTKRALNEAVPQILSAKPQMIADINGFLDQIKTKTGVDLRQFEQLAIGVSMKQSGNEGVDLEPVILARGKNNAGALIALAKLAANGRYREEKIGARTVYVFAVEPPKEIKTPDVPPSAGTGDRSAPSKEDSWLDKSMERTIDNFFKEIAVVAYDDNTLAAGSPARVRDTLNLKPRVGNAALTNLINRKPNAIAAFAVNLPSGLSNLVGLGNDEFGKTLDSIRQIRGSMELNNGETAVSMTAKTSKVEDAQNLRDTLQMLQMMGKSLLGGSQRADRQVYSRMVDNAKISLAQTEVLFDLQVPQTDINILLGAK